MYADVNLTHTYASVCTGSIGITNLNDWTINRRTMAALGHWATMERMEIRCSEVEVCVVIIGHFTGKRAVNVTRWEGGVTTSTATFTFSPGCSEASSSVWLRVIARNKRTKVNKPYGWTRYQTVSDGWGVYQTAQQGHHSVCVCVCSHR